MFILRSQIILQALRYWCLFLYFFISTFECKYLAEEEFNDLKKMSDSAIETDIDLEGWGNKT